MIGGQCPPYQTQVNYKFINAATLNLGSKYASLSVAWSVTSWQVYFSRRGFPVNQTIVRYAHPSSALTRSNGPTPSSASFSLARRGPVPILSEVTSQCGRIDLSKEPYVRSQCGRMRRKILPCTILAADNLPPSGPKSDQWCGRTVRSRDFAVSGTSSASPIFYFVISHVLTCMVPVLQQA